MKNYLSGFLLMVTCFAFAQSKTEHIQWKTLEEVDILMQKAPRKIIVDVYTDWCGWCKKMDKTTFDHPTIVKYVNQNFYAVKLDAETKKTINFNNNTYPSIGRYNKFAVQLLQGKMSFPTTAYLHENKQIITIVQSYLDAQEFDVVLHYIYGEEYKKITYDTFKKNYLKK